MRRELVGIAADAIIRGSEESATRSGLGMSRLKLGDRRPELARPGAQDSHPGTQACFGSPMHTRAKLDQHETPKGRPTILPG